MEFFDLELDPENLHLFAPSKHYIWDKLLYLSFSSGLPISTRPRQFQVGDPVLVSFAKLLLEIHLGQKIPIEVSHDDKEKNQLNWAKLHMCIDNIAEDQDNSYLQAVRGCLIVHSTISRALRPSDIRGIDAELTIRREIYKEIVSKLEIGLEESIPRPGNKRRRPESPPLFENSPSGAIVMVVRSNLHSEGTPPPKKQFQPRQSIQPLLPSRTQAIDSQLIH